MDSNSKLTLIAKRILRELSQLNLTLAVRVEHLFQEMDSMLADQHAHRRQQQQGVEVSLPHPQRPCRASPNPPSGGDSSTVRERMLSSASP